MKINPLKSSFFLALLVACWWATPAGAATIVVETNAQCNAGASYSPKNCAALGTTGDGDGLCSLGEAIVALTLGTNVGTCANLGSAAPFGTDDTIVLGTAGPYVFNYPDNFQPKLGPNALPVITTRILLEGNNSTLRGPDGAHADTYLRAFQINNLLTLQNVTFDDFNPGCARAYCGDGIVQQEHNESCDDGNTTDGDGCSSICVKESCGNHVVDPGEECEPNFGDPISVCNRFCEHPACGDGNLDHGEACDDGNTVSGDGCSNDCLTLETCGNGIADLGEACDDGNTTACDSCSANCQIEDYGVCYDGGAIFAPSTHNAVDGGNGAPAQCDYDHPTPSGLSIANSVFQNNGTMTNPTLMTKMEYSESTRGGALFFGLGSKIEIMDSSFTNNRSHLGGAIFSFGNNLAVDNSTFRNNSAVTSANQTDYTSAMGGALLSQVGTLTVRQSAFFSNLSTDAASPFSFYETTGGGIAALCSDFTLENSSVFQNEADIGGGLLAMYDSLHCDKRLASPEDWEAFLDTTIPLLPHEIFENTEAFLRNSTITGNDGAVQGGGIRIDGAESRVTMEESILAGNTSPSGTNCFGQLVSADHNLFGVLNDCTVDFGVAGTPHDLQAAAGLEACVTTGAPGEPHCAPSASSPALDQGGATCASVDQLDTDRYGPDAACDIGAIERNDLTACGNLILELGEECDDGNTTAGDGCGPTCKIELAPACGNGILEGAEQCDNGGANSDTAPDACRLNCTNPICGDSIVDILAGEQCDDGNSIPGDGCSACKTESSPGPVCGDGIIDPPGEQCDDGNTVASDGCNATCQSEVAPSFCGDGIVQGPGSTNPEECDDGNTTAGDGCNATCHLEVCGDGIINNNGSEQCDDGNTAAGDGCSTICQTETPPTPVCGNGILEAGEQCDDGNAVDTDACNNSCHIPFAPPICGNGLHESGEACDDGNTNPNDDCTNACQLPSCGDAIRHTTGTGPFEECDDGNTVDNDTCGNNCLDNFCGDGEVEAALGEQCDDGNATPGDGCEDTCLPTVPVCGNGILEAGEVCDDGNTNNHDACTNACQAARCGDSIVGLSEQCDDGDSDNNDACRNNCTAAVCGDGIVFTGVEQCDDGNSVSGDGCSSTCIHESIGDPSSPAGAPLATCGDGVVGPSEQCDAGVGNSDAPNSLCRTDCTRRRCGDGVIDTNYNEECDQGIAGSAFCSDTCGILAEEFPGCSIAIRDFLTREPHELIREYGKERFEECAAIGGGGGNLLKQFSDNGRVNVTPASGGCSLVR